MGKRIKWLPVVRIVRGRWPAPICAGWWCIDCSGTLSPVPAAGGRCRRRGTCPWCASFLLRTHRQTLTKSLRSFFFFVPINRHLHLPPIRKWHWNITGNTGGAFTIHAIFTNFILKTGNTGCYTIFAIFIDQPAQISKKFHWKNWQHWRMLHHLRHRPTGSKFKNFIKKIWQHRRMFRPIRRWTSKTDKVHTHTHLACVCVCVCVCNAWACVLISRRRR